VGVGGESLYGKNRNGTIPRSNKFGGEVGKLTADDNPICLVDYGGKDDEGENLAKLVAFDKMAPQSPGNFSSVKEYAQSGVGGTKAANKQRKGRESAYRIPTSSRSTPRPHNWTFGLERACKKENR